MSIDTDIEEAVLQVAKAKVAEAMGPDVIGKIVQNVMDHKSNTYGRGDDLTAFERLVRDCVLGALRQAIEERIGGGDVKDMIAKAADASVKKLAVTVADAFAQNDWRAQMEIKLGDES